MCHMCKQEINKVNAVSLFQGAKHMNIVRTCCRTFRWLKKAINAG